MSEESFKLVDTWIDRCQRESAGEAVEDHCYDPEWTGFRPSRTIEVGPADGSSEPRLVIHSGPMSGPLKWITLSHCWGGFSPMITTSENLEQRTQAILMSDIPKTFRDAVQITRHLGVRHLWIDSLCIIQNSKDDWAIEAARMGDVYRYSYLNIAANASKGANAGIFTHRSDAAKRVKLVLKSRAGNDEAELFVRRGKWDDYSYGLSDEASTLASRGWVLQESVLSPRTLHYTKQQMLWECQYFTFAEGKVGALVRRDLSDALAALFWVSNKFYIPRSMTKASTSNLQAEKDPEKRTQLYNGWRQLVQNYTRRNLTVSSDIFPAVAGVAAIFQAALGDRYLAGLFEGDILASLLWWSAYPDLAARRAPLLAPSVSTTRHTVYREVADHEVVELGINNWCHQLRYKTRLEHGESANCWQAHCRGDRRKSTSCWYCR